MVRRHGSRPTKEERKKINPMRASFRVPPGGLFVYGGFDSYLQATFHAEGDALDFLHGRSGDHPWRSDRHLWPLVLHCGKGTSMSTPTSLLMVLRIYSHLELLTRPYNLLSSRYFSPSSISSAATRLFQILGSDFGVATRPMTVAKRSTTTERSKKEPLSVVTINAGPSWQEEFQLLAPLVSRCFQVYDACTPQGEDHGI